MATGRFYLSVLALSCLGSMCVLFTVYWMWSWHGGFAWDGSILTFNCHPVLMVAGMVVVYSAGECEVSLGDVPGPGLGGAEQSRSGTGLCHCWAQGGGCRVGWSASGPSCHSEEEAVRVGARA